MNKYLQTQQFASLYTTVCDRKVGVFCAEMRSTEITSAPFTPKPVTSTETSVATSVTPGIIKAHNIMSRLFENCACYCSFIQYALYMHCN